MPDKTWKQAEREIAERFSTTRTGPLGQEYPDAISEAYTIEVKHRRKLPLWLKGALEQAERNNADWGDSKLPIVALHEHDQEYDDCLVVVRLKDFIDWFGV